MTRSEKKETVAQYVQRRHREVTTERDALQARVAALRKAIAPTATEDKPDEWFIDICKRYRDSALKIVLHESEPHRNTICDLANGHEGPCIARVTPRDHR